MDFIGYLSDMDSTTYLLNYDLIIMVVISILILYVIWLFLGWKELNYYVNIDVIIYVIVFWIVMCWFPIIYPTVLWGYSGVCKYNGVSWGYHGMSMGDKSRVHKIMSEPENIHLVIG